MAMLRTWGPAIAWMALIFLLSSQASDGHHSAIVVLLRKCAHVSEYLVLVLLLRRGVAAPMAMLIAVAYAVGDEWHQTFVHGRNGTPRDVAIDGIGIALAGILAPRLERRLRLA